MYDHDSDTYRFWVNEQTGTIHRARLYQIPEDWDSWASYWDDSEIVGFYDEGYQGVRALDTAATEDSERAITAYRYGGADSLDRLAPRLTGQADSRFICVGLDRGTDLYVLSWDGDPEGEWRREIEAISMGKIYRVETWEYQPGFGMGGSDWVESDNMCEEWYGEDKAAAEFVKEWPLDSFPADLVVASRD